MQPVPKTAPLPDALLLFRLHLFAPSIEARLPRVNAQTIEWNFPPSTLIVAPVM